MRLRRSLAKPADSGGQKSVDGNYRLGSVWEAVVRGSGETEEQRVEPGIAMEGGGDVIWQSHVVSHPSANAMGGATRSPLVREVSHVKTLWWDLAGVQVVSDSEEGLVFRLAKVLECPSVGWCCVKRHHGYS